MRLSIILIIILSLAGARSATSQDTNPAPGKPPVISVGLHAERDTVKTGAPIVMKATLTNLSDHEITFGYDRSRSGIVEVDVLAESGKFATDKRPGYVNGRIDLERLARTVSPEQLAKSGLVTGHLVYVPVKPGGTLDDVIDVSKFYDMTEPGVYMVVVERKDPESGAPVQSSPIKVTVTK